MDVSAKVTRYANLGAIARSCISKMTGRRFRSEGAAPTSAGNGRRPIEEPEIGAYLCGSIGGCFEFDPESAAMEPLYGSLENAELIAFDPDRAAIGSIEGSGKIERHARLGKIDNPALGRL